MDLIYIIDSIKNAPEDANNLEIQAVGNLKESSWWNLIGMGAGASTLGAVGTTGATALGAVALPITAVPAALLISVATVSPLIYRALSREDSNEKNIDNDISSQLDSFLEKHGVSKEMAREFGFSFPPGHPVVGQSYRLHPLAYFPEANKENVYIPESHYDDILLEERESELIKLLIHLGAKKIDISVAHEHNDYTAVAAEIGGEMKVGGVALGGEKSTNEIKKNNNSRIFELKGKSWDSGSRLDRKGFAWLNFEPTWDTLILARELGECTQAAVEIKEKSSYSEDKLLSTDVKNKVLGVKGQASMSQASELNKVFIVNVLFPSSQE